MARISAQVCSIWHGPRLIAMPFGFDTGDPNPELVRVDSDGQCNTLLKACWIEVCNGQYLRRHDYGEEV
jgi:hypothetical protein